MNCTIQTIQCYQDLLIHWPFFDAALESLNSTVEHKVPGEEFLARHMDIVMGEREGLISLALSNGRKVGLISAYDSCNKYKPKTALVYAAYAVPGAAASDRNSGVLRQLYNHVESWARGQNYTALHTYSGRTSGAAIRWFRTYGFNLNKLLLTKEL